MKIGTIIAGAMVIAFGLAGCGAVYITPSVKGGMVDGAKVRVVSLTSETAVAANRSTYISKQLPRAFYSNAGAGGALRTGGTVPASVSVPEVRPAALERRLPPELGATPYRIGVGDVMLLATPRGSSSVEELSGLLAAQNRRQGFTVQDDGAIAIPDVGRIQVSGLTLDEAENAMFQNLVSAQIDPAFSLEVAEFNSHKISIGGAVSRPTVVAITLVPLYLDEAIAEAGGVTAQDFDFTSVRIYRDGTLYQVPLRDIYANNGLSRIRLVDGDSVFVDTEFSIEAAKSYFSEQIRLAEFRAGQRATALRDLQSEINTRRQAFNEERSNFKARQDMGAVERDYVFLTGEVRNQGRVTLPFEQVTHLADVLYDTGGFGNRTGNPAQIYVLRGSNNASEFGAVTAWHLDARNPISMLAATSFEMRPNDIVFIAPQAVTRWNRVVSQITPALINTGVRAANN